MGRGLARTYILSVRVALACIPFAGRSVLEFFPHFATHPANLAQQWCGAVHHVS